MIKDHLVINTYDRKTTNQIHQVIIIDHSITNQKGSKTIKLRHKINQIEKQ